MPENTETNPQPEGTIVKPKENWNIETVKAISVGNGQTIPVPIGFYYVGGDLSSGVIISDNQEDQYDGITDKTTWEYTTSLKGNQFVWIPCTEEEYVKTGTWNGSMHQNANWDTTTYDSELPQIRKYGGFYVGRYEAGLAETIEEFTSMQQHTNANQVYNIDKVNDVTTKPQSRAGVIPWNFIDWNHAKTNAKNMYNTESVSSGLITGTQWDVMLKTFIGKEMSDGTELTEADLTNPEKWGNYMTNSIEYTGRMARAWLSGGYWWQAAFGEKETSKTTSYGSNNGDLLTTGASKQTGVYHIYDVAGNLWEHTDEVSLYGGNTATQYRMARGGASIDTKVASSHRGTNAVDFTYINSGFRVVLYIK